MFAKIKDIVDREGFTGLLHRGLTLPGRRNWLGMRYEERYYYERTVEEGNPLEYMPRRSDITFHIVRTNKEADALEAEGYEFRSYQTKASKGLDIGGIAFCIFIGRELAYISWVALSEKAKPYVDDWPFKVDFANKEICIGATLTIPKYRGYGLMQYGKCERTEFLRQMGVVKSRFSVGIYNTVSNHVQVKYGGRIYAKARYLRILGFESWKETPLNISPDTALKRFTRK
jgi:hypothetical protein